MAKNNVFRLMADIYSPDIKLRVRSRDGKMHIEGSRKSLRWLAQVIRAYSDQRFDDDFWIEPKGPGSTYFSRGSTHGIYLYNSDNERASGRARQAAASRRKRARQSR